MKSINKIKKVVIVIIMLVSILVIMCVIFALNKGKSKENDIKPNNEQENNQQSLFLSSKANDNDRKDEIFSLIDKGIKANENIEAFMYSKELFNTDKFTRMFFDKEYGEFIEILKIEQYKEDNFDFHMLRETDDYISGSFYEKNDEKNKEIQIADIVVNKLNGRIMIFERETLHVTIY